MESLKNICPFIYMPLQILCFDNIVSRQRKRGVKNPVLGLRYKHCGLSNIFTLLRCRSRCKSACEGFGQTSDALHSILLLYITCLPLTLLLREGPAKAD